MKQEFLKLYDETVDEIFGYCYQNLGDKELAKTVTQDTYTKMWSSITPGYPLDSAKIFLHGIASRYVRQYQHAEGLSQHHVPTNFKFA